MIDASHDNSSKDHERQPAAAADVAAQVAAGNAAIVGVMLESFLVAGRQDHDGGAKLRYGQSITDACMDWDTTSEVLEAAGDGGARRAGADEVRIAVLGVGLIGGSIGLAAREHVEDAEVGGLRPRPGRLRRALELGAIDRAADSIAEARRRAPRSCFACAPGGRAARAGARRAGAPPGRTAS